MAGNNLVDVVSDTLHGVADVVHELRGCLADMQKQLAIAHADAAGRLAQVRAIEAQHPSSPLLAESGRVFQTEGHSGLPKTELRLLYEAAFDEHLRGENVDNPASFRLD